MSAIMRWEMVDFNAKEGNVVAVYIIGGIRCLVM